jgi:GTP pyrophosphokinase
VKESHLEYSNRVVDAFAYAHELHREQVRKQSDVPYITHLIAVAALVGGGGGDEDQFIAALLHDAAEDQGGYETLEAIRGRFGDTVAGYVAGCTDAFENPKPDWRERKTRYIAHVSGASEKQKLIVASDKLHNARCILSDLQSRGDGIWDMFNKGREATLWYYAEMVRNLGNGWDHPILRELAHTVDRIHRHVADMG